MDGENSHEDQTMDRQGIDVHHWDCRVRVQGPGAAAIDSLEVLLGQVANPVDQDQHTNCMLVRHLKFPNKDLKIEACRHTWSA